MKRRTLISILTALLFAPIQFADAQTEQVFFGNLHSHTSYSDGSSTPRRAYRHARDVADLDFLAITEHNHRRAPSRIATDHDLYNGSGRASLISSARSFTRNGRFIALYGQEFSTISSGNHANVFEVGDVIDTNDVPNGEWDDLLNTWLPNHPDSQGQPPILLLNHPTNSSSPNDIEYGRAKFGTSATSLDTWRNTLDASAQLINMINGPAKSSENPGRPSEGEFKRYLDLGFHLAPTADQDNHFENWGSAADTRTGVITTSLTKPNILAAMRARHVYATQDRNLRIIAKVNDQLTGTRFSGSDVPNAGDELDIEIDIRDDDEAFVTYTIDVFADHIGGAERADVIAQFTATGNGTFTLPGVTYDGGHQYFFFKITQTNEDDEEDHAWLAPVWFEPDTPITTTDPVLTLQVNLATEEATITNIGGTQVDLDGWTLVSEKGNQRLTFSSSLPLSPGQAVVVTSGSNARNQPPGFLLWTRSFVWSNSGDPGQLLDPQGRLRASAP